jgi:cysteine desulfurase family protein (TIGR01976 family)
VITQTQRDIVEMFSIDVRIADVRITLRRSNTTNVTACEVLSALKKPTNGMSIAFLELPYPPMHCHPDRSFSFPNGMESGVEGPAVLADATQRLEAVTLTTMPTTEAVRTALDLPSIRAQFPSLAQTVNAHPATFLDGPGGTQVPQRVIDAISNYLCRDNANTGGAYATSRHTDAMIAEARAAMGDFLHCAADEVVFGPNMTTLTYAMSRAIGRAISAGELGPGNEILITRLDHDANVSPWLQMAEDRGITVRWAELRQEDCTLDMADLASKINSNTKLVAAGYASNAVGTINPVKEIVRLAHAAGALAYIDAVHYAPHGLVDVAALDCDFLVCSTYKFFGPHLGVLFGKREHLQRLRPYKVRPNTNAIPNCWEWGTLNHESIAGITACVEYLADLGSRFINESTNGATDGTTGTRVPQPSRFSKRGNDAADASRVNESGINERRAAIAATYQAIHNHERELLDRMMSGLKKIPHLKIYGITDPARFSERCATLAIRIEDGSPSHTPLQLATKLGTRGIFTWDGNYYALNLTEQLDVEKSGGFLRIGLVHYNTQQEVDRLLTALGEIVSA